MGVTVNATMSCKCHIRRRGLASDAIRRILERGIPVLNSSGFAQHPFRPNQGASDQSVIDARLDFGRTSALASSCAMTANESSEVPEFDSRNSPLMSAMGGKLT